MYPLLVNYRAFCGVCTELAIDPAAIGKFLQGRDTRIMQTDRELGALTAAARRAGLAPVFAAAEAERLAGTLTAAGGTAGSWMSRFGDFLQEFGYRTEGSARMAVGVVALVDARSSGVAFSVHPRTGKRDRVVIEANWGWGGALVQGLVVPDRVAAVLAVEERYGHPVDVEWVLDRSGGPPWVVQARPVTGLPDREPVTGWDPVRYASGDTA